MTQRQLADAAHMQQSNIAEIEAGKRPVSQRLLERILAASGYGPAASVAVHADALKARGEALGIHNIRVFGSVARGEDRRDSDIDLLIDLSPSDTPFRLGTFHADAELQDS